MFRWFVPRNGDIRPSLVLLGYGPISSVEKPINYGLYEILFESGVRSDGPFAVRVGVVGNSCCLARLGAGDFFQCVSRDHEPEQRGAAVSIRDHGVGFGWD